MGLGHHIAAGRAGPLTTAYEHRPQSRWLACELSARLVLTHQGAEEKPRCRAGQVTGPM